MSLATGYAFNLEDLFYNFNVRRLKITSGQCEKLYGDRHKTALCAKVMRESMKIILDDILENNVTFELPTGRKKADIHMKTVTGEDFKKARQNGGFKGIDFLKSYFTGYRPCFYMYSNNRTRVKPIHMSVDYTKRLADKINNGMKYC